MPDPWAVITPILQPVLIIGAAGAVWKLLFSGRIDDIKEERDRAIEDRNLAREEATRARAEWKDSVRALRTVRREVEAAETGTSSTPPPPEDHDYEDRTGRIHVIGAEDRAWSQQREKERARKQLEADSLSRAYLNDMSSTPPDPPQSPLQGPRKRLPSRPR